MRRPCRKPGPGLRPRTFGCLTIIIGIFIVLAMMLPAGFWWFALAVVLIVFGLWLMTL